MPEAAPPVVYDPVSMIKPKRKITGISAVLLPYHIFHAPPMSGSHPL